MTKKKIKPQDLRIGNWVGRAWKGIPTPSGIRVTNSSPLQITAIDGLWVRVCREDSNNSYVMLYDEIEPIPLTDKLMRKCGFAKQEKYGCYVSTDCENVEVVIAKKLLYTDAYIVVNDYRTQPCIHCRYLHELQNCYFAITGEELDIKLCKSARKKVCR